jgi:hypothetical protein
MKPLSPHKRSLIIMIGSLAWATSNAFLRSSSGSAFVRQAQSQTPVFTSASRFSTTILQSSVEDDDTATTSDVPIYKSEGLFAVEKPLDWTSSDVVSYIRGILERDAKNRGAPVVSFRSRRNKSQKVKVGHGGTLDPLASGVLVVGVGKGTKELQQ